mgnify:CR=1 FL=1
MQQNNTNKLMGLLILFLLAFIYFLWQQNIALQAQLEAHLKSPEINTKTVETVIPTKTKKNSGTYQEPKSVYKPPVGKTEVESAELQQLQKMLGDLIKLKEGLE